MEATHDVVGAPVFVPPEQRQQLSRCLAVVKRTNQGLLNAERSVDGPRVTPGFQIVGHRHVPPGMNRGLIHFRSKMNRRFDFPEILLELQIYRSVVAGVATKHHKCADLTRRHGVSEILD